MYVSIAIVRAILDSLRQQGVATPEFCSRIGLQPEEFSDPTHRLPVNRVDSIVRAAIAVTGDPALGLHVGESAPVGALHVVGHLLANSGSLREAIQLYVRYAPLIVESSRWRLVEQGDDARFLYEQPPVPDANARFHAELSLALVTKMGLSFLPPGKRAKVVRFRYAPPSYAAEYERIFRCPVEFGAREYEVVFDRQLLDVPHLHRDEPLCEVLKQRADALLASRNSDERMLERLRELLRYESDLGEVDLERLARRLGLGARSLQRRLQERGASLSQLLDEARREKALEALRVPEVDVKELAHRLGFSERSAFQRAFKRWTGLTPIQYRESAAMQHRKPASLAGRRIADLGSTELAL